MLRLLKSLNRLAIRERLSHAKFNVPCAAFAVIRDELIVSLVDKPLLHSYKLHRAQQAPRKIVMPGKVVSLCPAGVGHFLFGGIGGSLYSWHAGSGRCIQSVHIHYKDVSIIRANHDFVLTGEHNNQLLNNNNNNCCLTVV